MSDNVTSSGAEIVSSGGTVVSGATVMSGADIVTSGAVTSGGTASVLPTVTLEQFQSLSDRVSFLENYLKTEQDMINNVQTSIASLSTTVKNIPALTDDDKFFLNKLKDLWG